MARNRAERLDAFAQLFDAALRTLGGKSSPKGIDTAVARVADALVEDVKASGDLALTITGQGLKAGGVDVGAGPLAAAIAAPLLRDAVREITFVSGLTMDEALPLCALWVRCAQAPRGTDGVATRVWELDRPHVTLTRLLPAQGVSDKVLSEAEQLGRDLVAPEVPPIVLAHLSDDRMTPTLMALKAVDLVPETVTTDTAQWVQQIDALGAELVKPRANALRHFAEALVRSGDVAVGNEADALAAIWERLVRAFVAEHRFLEPLDAFLRVTQAAKTEAGRALLVRLRGTMTSAWFMERMVESINAADTADDALAGLRRMGAAAVRSLSAAPTLNPEGKRRVATLLAELDVDSRRMAQTAAISQVTSQLDHLGAFSNEQAREILKRALLSSDVAVRKQALERMTSAHAMLVTDALHERLKDPSLEVRLLTLKHIAAVEDPTAVPTLVAQLQRTTTGKEERIRIYDALGAIGGARAGALLADELHKQTDVAVKIEAAKALGRIDHPRTREVLKAEAGRMLAPAELRKVCKEALDKLGGGS